MFFEIFKSKVLVLSSGERVPIIYSKDSQIPHHFANQYLLSRRGIISMRTLNKEAIVICSLINWVSSEEWISIVDFIDNMGARSISGLWEHLKTSALVGKKVSGATHMYRWKAVQKFLQYISSRALLKMSHRDPTFEALCLKRDLIFKEMKRLDFRSHNARLQGLDSKVIDFLLTVTRVDSEENPWIKRDRLRNQLILDMLIVLGMRASELLKITVSDFDNKSSIPSLTIKRVQDDPEDPRTLEPRVKTFGRILDLSRELSLLLDEYLKTRRNIPEAKKTKYLFVSNTNGKPLSYAGLHRIVSKLEDIFPDLSGTNLTPHSFRRTWNDRYRETGEKLGINEEMITQGQNYLQGRVLNSSEAYKYARKHIEKSARETHLKYQDELLNMRKNKK